MANHVLPKGESIPPYTYTYTYTYTYMYTYTYTYTKSLFNPTPHFIHLQGVP